MINVTVWNENQHERLQPEVRKIYPDGIHGCIADFLSKNEDLNIRTATFDEEEHGLTQKVLDNTDVLIYWSHMAQEEFSDEVAERIHTAVLKGMGLIALHSAHYSKMIKRLLGTSMTLNWRHADRERLFVTAPQHPIAKDIPDHFELPVEEMYGEYFDIPKPDDVVFTGWFAGGEVFRSGCTFTRGLGKIFYFQPGHEMYPTYYDRNIQRIITNAVYWCAPVKRLKTDPECREAKTPLEIAGGYTENTEKKQSEQNIKLSIFHEHLREAGEQTGKTFKELLNEARRSGISGVEVEYSTLIEHPELVQEIKDAGMEISNLYQFFDFVNHYEAEIRTGHKMIETAQTLGIARVMIIPGFLEHEQSQELNRVSAGYDKTAACMEQLPEILTMRDALRELLAFASDKGITVTMEDFDSFTSPIARMNQLKWFMDQVPGLKHTLDMGNYAFSNENVTEAYELFKDRIGHVHCKDRGMEKEDDPSIRKELGVPADEELLHRRGLKPVPVGDGYIPIAELVKKLKSQGYHGYLAIEHFGAPDQLGFMRKSADFLHALLE